MTVTNPPATPRATITNPTFPVAPFERGVANNIRPVQWDLENPRVHVYNFNVQQALPSNIVPTVGYAGSRGRHLLRQADVNTSSTGQARGWDVVSPPAGRPRKNPNFSTIELKSS